MKDNRSRKRTNGVFNEMVIDKYCLAMDNYFTLPKIIAILWTMDVGVVGTARFERNWPKKEWAAALVANTMISGLWLNGMEDDLVDKLKVVAKSRTPRLWIANKVLFNPIKWFSFE